MKGTDSLERRWVRGDCACGEVNALLYELEGALLCAECYRRDTTRDREETCEGCGGGPAWRDPITRRNEFYCAKCHASRGMVFQNRWARASEDTVAQSMPISDRREKCEVRDSSCFGQTKPRAGRVLCDKHAGKPRR